MLKALDGIDPKEYPDPEPVELPAELKQPITIEEKIKRIVAAQIQANNLQVETEDEANDLDVKGPFDDDEGYLHPHEIQDMEMEFPEGDHLRRSLGMEPNEDPASTKEAEPPKGVASESKEPIDTLEQKGDD